MRCIIILFTPFFLLLEIIVWECGRANGYKIEAQSMYSNAGTLRDSDLLSREIQKRASGLMNQPMAVNIMASPISFNYNQAIPGRIAQPGISGYGRDGNMIGHAGASAVVDFNPALLRGYRGQPGIKIRINRRSFQYATTLAQIILNREIVKFEIPDITQNIKEFYLEVTICNIYISNYRQPECLVIFPAPPNQIVFTVNDFDIGLAGNLDGVINAIFPIQIFGIVHVNFYHMSVSITLKVIRSIYGTPQVVVCGCAVEIPYADVCIENGGLLGEIANLFFRKTISERVRSIAPNAICGMLPTVINERINPILARIPQSISFMQIINLFKGLLGGSKPAHCYSPQCQARLSVAKLPPSSRGIGVSPPRNPPPLPLSPSSPTFTMAKLPPGSKVIDASPPRNPPPLPLSPSSPTPTVAKIPPNSRGIDALPPRNPPLLPLPPLSSTSKQNANRVASSKTSIAKIAASVPTHVAAQQVQPKFRNNIKEKEKKTESFGTVTNNGEIVGNGTSTIKEKSSSNGLVTKSNAQYYNQSTQSTQRILSIVAHPFARTKSEMEELESLLSDIRKDIINLSRTVQSSSMQQSQQTATLRLSPEKLYQQQQQQQQNQQRLSQQQNQQQLSQQQNQQPLSQQQNQQQLSQQQNQQPLSQQQNQQPLSQQQNQQRLSQQQNQQQLSQQQNQQRLSQQQNQQRLSQQQNQQRLSQQQEQKTAQKLLRHSSAKPLVHNSKIIATSNQLNSRKPSDQFNRAASVVSFAVPLAKGFDKISGDFKLRAESVGGVNDFRGKINDPCAGCTPDDSFDAFRNLIIQQLDLRKVANLFLTTQLLQSHATFYDYSLDLNGEFSPNGRGGTPFGPFPMQWPISVGSSMIEILISDFTINSLLYWIHKSNFFSFRIGPEAPGIGTLLTTGCDISNDNFSEENENESLFIRLLRLTERRHRYYHYHQKRSKRQMITGGDSSLGNLADLGICLGDILPAVKEEYPNSTLALFIHSARAPSIIISRRGGGSIQIDLTAFIDIYLDRTNVRVGTITVIAVGDIMLRITGQRISGNATLPIFKLLDRDQTLGLSQDALDNLASLAKDIILKGINQQLNRGMEISLPTSTLPLNIISPRIAILEHSIHIASDFTASSSALSMLS
ncbi:unnamed protein product [Cercopithifilaria johnstoni]|uniref:Lipid-binding serum glycoprotein C-terminal domain-containing protein n=1 Tax=Cercopithifilaria johnstoni TaxID=2874296 RepID=A0A8J2MBP7_9BILA|nr:unnamed protein product [Cercopithifilaria johnstoni]